MDCVHTGQRGGNGLSCGHGGVQFRAVPKPGIEISISQPGTAFFQCPHKIKGAHRFRCRHSFSVPGRINIEIAPLNHGHTAGSHQIGQVFQLWRRIGDSREIEEI